MPMCSQLRNEPGMKPPAHLHQCHWHTEFCLTTCDSGTLLSHFPWTSSGSCCEELPTTASWKGSTFQLPFSLPGRVQVHNHHTEGLSAEMGNVSYIENGNTKTLQCKSCTGSSSSLFDVIQVWMTTVTASSAVSKHSSQQALLTLPGQQRKGLCCASDEVPVCPLPCRSLLSPSLSLSPPGLSRCCGSEDPHCGIPRFKKHQIEPNLAHARVEIV